MVIWPSAKCYIRAHGLNSRGEGRTSGIYRRHMPMEGGGGGGNDEPEKPRPDPPNHYCLKELRKEEAHV